MTHTVVVNQFEGPLGLLIELIEQGKFEVTTISVARITADYLARIRSLTTLNAEEIGEFAGLGARLIYIKSLALLPQTAASEQAEELQQLNLELQDYMAIKEAAAKLALRSQHHSWPHPARKLARPDTQYTMPNVALEDLKAAFTAALTRTRPIMPAAPLATGPHVSLERVTENLKQQLAHGRLYLGEILEQCSSQLEVIVTFMATLELIHAGSVRVGQASQFAPITLEPHHA